MSTSESELMSFPVTVRAHAIALTASWPEPFNCKSYDSPAYTTPDMEIEHLTGSRQC